MKIPPSPNQQQENKLSTNLVRLYQERNKMGLPACTSNEVMLDYMKFLSRDDVREQLQKACTEAVTAERLIKISQTLLRKGNYDSVDRGSFINALLECASLGVEPVLGRVYFVPYRNSLQVVLGYQGMLDLARRGGVWATAHNVYQDDEFEWTAGFSEDVIHKPNIKGSREDGAIIGSYCVWKDPKEKHVEYMTIGEIKKIQRCSKAGNYGPWKDYFGEMCKKTVVRRAAKYWPLTSAFSMALERDDERNFVDFSRFPADKAQLVETESSADERLSRRLTATEKTEKNS